MLKKLLGIDLLEKKIKSLEDAREFDKKRFERKHESQRAQIKKLDTRIDKLENNKKK